MIAVLDVSAAIEILLKKGKKELFDASFQGADWVLAPDLFVPEITNVLWKYHKAKVIDHEECVQLVGDGIEMIDDFIDSKELWKEALSEGIKNGHSIYDMYYLISARRNDATLLTNDGSLAKLSSKMKIDFVN